jgi:pimeloyl-ACP methyl ester carboxylesterase
MTTTVRIQGSRAREQVPGTGITLLAPGFRGAMTQLGANETSAGFHALPFARAAAGADVMIAAQLTITLEARLPDDSSSLRRRSAAAGHPRLIVPRRSGVSYSLLQTDEQGFSSFVLPESRHTSEASFPLTIGAALATRRTMRVLMWPEQHVEGAGALAAASRWERLRRPDQLQQLGPRGWQAPDWDQLRRGPVLLLLHGTFGTPHGTFVDWIEHDSFRAISRRYEDRCLAFAHPTLSASIEENAAWLTAHLLAIGAPIDIVAHGRGGLLARRLAADPRLSLRRVCQVGTPNNGTALAMVRNLPQFLDGHVALLARSPQQKAESILEGAMCMARFVALEPPVELPGLAEMTPGSTRAQYSRPERERGLANGNEFDSEPNDLLVPAAGCHEPGVKPVDTLRLGGSDVHHHNYFANQHARERLELWLR